MVVKPSRADLIWQSGFRAGPRLRRFFARILWSILTLGPAARLPGPASRRHS